MKDQTAIAAPLAAFAIIVNPADNVAVVKTEVGPGITLRLPDGREVTTRGYRHPRASSRHAGDSRWRVRPAVRSANRHVARDRGRGLYYARVDEQRRARRARPARRICVGTAAVRARAGAALLHGVPPRQRPGGHAQLPAHRADQHVRQPRGAADRDDGGVLDLQARALPERRRGRRHPAQPRLWMCGRVEHPGDAADALELRRSPERRGRDLHWPRV